MSNDASTVTIDNTVTLDGATIYGGSIDDTGTLSVERLERDRERHRQWRRPLTSTATNGQILTLDAVTTRQCTLAASLPMPHRPIDNTVTLAAPRQRRSRPRHAVGRGSLERDRECHRQRRRHAIRRRPAARL